MPAIPDDPFKDANIKNAIKRNQRIIDELDFLSQGISEIQKVLRDPMITEEQYAVYAEGNMEAILDKLKIVFDMMKRNRRYIIVRQLYNIATSR